MITIVEPKEHIAKLWGKQKVRESDTYRLMRYVLRVDHEGKVLLHNVVTGQLVVLSEEEARALDQLPTVYTPTMEQLVSEHYLVPENFDERHQVVNLRHIMRSISDTRQDKGLTFYTILPTTACNARCYYCFERGVPAITMSEQTADEVIEFIATQRNGKSVHLKWFGGEPTVGAQRITQICKGLIDKEVPFSSSMTTNGYLFDEEMCDQAAQIWNLDHVLFSMDGTGEYYNKIKNYVGACDNPYERVLRNVGLLLKRNITVTVRMNFDQTNESEFAKLLADIGKRYPPNPNLQVSAHYINDVQIVDGQEIHHGSNAWYNEKVHELHQLARSKGYLGQDESLACLNYRWCPAASKRAVTITPSGKLVCCYEFLGDEDAKGDIRNGITDQKIDQSWRRFADVDECAACVLFPDCPRILRCKRNDDCFVRTEKTFVTTQNVIRHYNNVRSHVVKGERV